AAAFFGFWCAGRKNPNSPPECKFPADARELTVLQDMEQLGLERGMQVADLVEEDCPSMRRLELADLELVGAGEGAAFVAKQLALQELARHRGAIDLHEGPAPSRGKMVDGARDQLLARARLAGDQDGDVDAGGLADDLARFQHFRTGPELDLPLNSASQLFGSGPRPEHLGLWPNELVDGLLEFVVVQGLVQHCVDLERGHGKPIVVAIGHRDDWSGISSAQL